jgi:hypothetical protein
MEQLPKSLRRSLTGLWSIDGRRSQCASSASWPSSDNYNISHQMPRYSYVLPLQMIQVEALQALRIGFTLPTTSNMQYLSRFGLT